MNTDERGFLDSLTEQVLGAENSAFVASGPPPKLHWQ
jgi:hypothetical protein